jgi:hypothetical protein
MRSRRNMVIGAAGLGYVVGAAVENMGLLDAPLLGAPDAEIRAAHADHAVGVVGTACGALSLMLYLVFPVAIACAGLATSGAGIRVRVLAPV